MEKVAKNKGKKGRFKKAIATGLVLYTLLLPKFMYGSQKSHSPQKEKAPISLIVGARGGPGLYGGEVGLGVGKFALVGNLGSGPDENLQNTEENVFGNVYFQGREDLKNPSYFGGALEYHFPGWVIGAGGGLEKVTREIEENLVRNGTTIASNKTSAQENKFAGYLYTGPKIKITKGLSLNLNAGYKTGLKKGFLANFRIIYQGGK